MVVSLVACLQFYFKGELKTHAGGNNVTDITLSAQDNIYNYICYICLHFYEEFQP